MQPGYKKLNARHRMILRLHVRGLKNLEIAEFIGVTPQNVATVINSPVFQMAYKEFQANLDTMFSESEIETETNAEFRKAILGEILPSLNTLIGLRDSAQSETVRQKSASEILGMSGVANQTQTLVPVAAIVLPPEAATNITRALQDIGVISSLDLSENVRTGEPEDEEGEDFPDGIDEKGEDALSAPDNG